jgi:hypothetical protein
MRLLAPRFTMADAIRAADAWGFNCGPAAVAGVLHLTIDELRPHLGDFEQKRYTNPTLMQAILARVEAPVLRTSVKGEGYGSAPLTWPAYGLCRVQWEGPWMEPGVPVAARYKYTHWVGVDRMLPEEEPSIFDVNCLRVGGWVPMSEWVCSLVPWLLPQISRRATGRWHITHAIAIDKAKVAPQQ